MEANTVTSALQPLQSAISSAITPATIMTVIGGVLALGLTFVVVWFGAKKLITIAKNAIFKGKMSV